MVRIPFWIQQVLREQLKFDGIVFSDDLSMSGAASVGGYTERAKVSLQAGCDMLLVCNDHQAADEVLDYLIDYNNPVSQLRLVRVHGRPQIKNNKLFSSDQWLKSVESLQAFMLETELTQSDDLFE